MDAGPRERKFPKKLFFLSCGGAWMRGHVNFVLNKKMTIFQIKKHDKNDSFFYRG
jgi:hypothetical protein